MFVLILHHSVWGGTPHISSAPTQGHPSPGRSALSLLRCGERPCDTLRALPENTAAPVTQAKKPPHEVIVWGLFAVHSTS